MDEAFLQDLVAEAAQYLCFLSKRANVIHPDVLQTDSSCEFDSINRSLELIWDVSFSSSAAEAMGNQGCIELLWGIAFQSDDDRIQELCLGAMANMCLQSACCCRLLNMPGAAAACTALCAPSTGLDTGSGSYVQALRLSRVILGDRASAPHQQDLLRPFLDSNVCRLIVALFPQGQLQLDSELQAALLDLLILFFECAPDCDLFAQISDNFVRAGTFAVALRAAQGVFSDIVRIARFLSICQNHAVPSDLNGQCDAGYIICACVVMLAHPSLSCCGVALVCDFLSNS